MKRKIALTALVIVGALGVRLALTSLEGISNARAGSALMAIGAQPAVGAVVDKTAPPDLGPATLHDPTADPSGYISDLQAAKSSGWPLLVLVGVFGLCEGLAFAGKRSTKLAWLGTGRVSIVIGAVAALAASSYNTLTSGGTWLSVATAAVGALLLYAHPAAADVAKKAGA